MEGLIGSSAGVAALMVFVSVALGTVAAALLMEWLAERRRRMAALRELRAMADLPGGEARVLQGADGSVPAWLRAIESQLPQIHDLERLLRQAAVGWSAGVFVLIVLGAGLALGLATLVVTRSPLPAAVGAAAGAWMPYYYVLRRRRKRLAAFEEGLPEAIDLLGRAIRAGHPLSAGLKMVSEECAEPISGEFRRTFEEQRFGVPFDDALLGLADRVSTVDVRILTTAVLIQREVGGNLAEVLDNLAAVIRARFTIRRQLRVYTAQGRMTGYVLAILPIAVASVIYLLNPEYMSLLWTHPAGRLMMGTAIVLQLIGYYWIRRIIDIEI